MKPTSPCYHCGERVIGCHSECDLYLTFRRALDKYNDTVRKHKADETRVTDYTVKQVEKTRRK